MSGFVPLPDLRKRGIMKVEMVLYAVGASWARDIGRTGASTDRSYNRDIYLLVPLDIVKGIGG